MPFSPNYWSSFNETVLRRHRQYWPSHLQRCSYWLISLIKQWALLKIKQILLLFWLYCVIRIKALPCQMYRKTYSFVPPLMVFCCVVASTLNTAEPIHSKMTKLEINPRFYLVSRLISRWVDAGYAVNSTRKMLRYSCKPFQRGIVLHKAHLAQL